MGRRGTKNWSDLHIHPPAKMKKKKDKRELEQSRVAILTRDGMQTQNANAQRVEWLVRFSLEKGACKPTASQPGSQFWQHFFEKDVSVCDVDAVEPERWPERHTQHTVLLLL